MFSYIMYLSIFNPEIISLKYIRDSKHQNDQTSKRDGDESYTWSGVEIIPLKWVE